MDSLRLIDVLFGVVGGLLAAFGMVLYGMLKGNADDVKATAQDVNDERARTAALVLNEKEKLAALVKAEHDRIDEKFTQFRIKVAEDYATTSLVEKIMAQVTLPISKKLDEIEGLLNMKLDRREFDQHREHIKNNNGHSSGQ